MAAPLFSSLKIYRKLSYLLKCLHLRETSSVLWHKRHLAVCQRSSLSSLIFSAAAFTTKVNASSLNDANAEKPMNFEPNDPRLRSHECLKNAAGLSVDSTSAVLSQTVYAVSKIGKEYVELVNVLIVLMEYQLQVLGHAAEENRIADLIVETRHEVNKIKQRKEDLNLLFGSVEKLADATAEVAFAVGAEYASTSTGERLYSAQQEVTRVRVESEEVDRRLSEAQAKSIEMLAQHEEKTQWALKEQELQCANDNQEMEMVSNEEPSSSKEKLYGDLESNGDLNEEKELT